jgi:hypothetical protein
MMEKTIGADSEKSVLARKRFMLLNHELAAQKGVKTI